MRFFFACWFPVLLWAGMIFYLSSIPALESGLPWTGDLLLRKLGHIFEYAVLTRLLERGLRAHGCPRVPRLLWSASLALVYAIGDEAHQHFVPGRLASMSDVAVDGVGISMALIYLGRRREGGSFAQRASEE